MNESGTMSDELRRRDRPMTETKIVVPEGMLEAALEGLGIEIVHARRQYVKAALEAALRWLSENPIVPTDEFVERVVREHSRTNVKWACSEWQRIMLKAPEPSFSKEVVFVTPGDYRVHVPTGDMAPSFEPVETEIEYASPETNAPAGFDDLLVNPVIGMINGQQVNDRIVATWNRAKAMYSSQDKESSQSLINIEPRNCPHSWCAKIEKSTSECVVFCELCGWVYSRESLASLRRGRESK